MAAGRAARTLARIEGNVLGDWAVRSGWLARARAHLEEAGVDRPEHGWVQIIKAFSEPDAQVRESLLREAIAIGRRFRAPDVEFLAMAYLGGLFWASAPSTSSTVALAVGAHSGERAAGGLALDWGP
jgi:hypothetical protein